MKNDLIPKALHVPFKQFLHELDELGKASPTYCPYCKGLHFSQTRAEPLTFRCKTCAKYFNGLSSTPFNRLLPINWLAAIFIERSNRETYQTIANLLGCSVKQVIRRDKAIKLAMKERYPDLHKWYQANNESNSESVQTGITKALTVQHSMFTKKITKILNTTKSTCLYCWSPNTVKIGQRTAFLCRACSRGFNLLSDSPISHLRHTDKWILFLDLLVQKQSTQEIAKQLNFNINTVQSWRRKWVDTMRYWGFDELAIWCK